MADKYYFAIGRRKTTTASVRLYEGQGQNTINEKELSTLSYLERYMQKLMLPFSATETTGKFYFTAMTNGGGTTGQADAVAMAIARALTKFEPSFRGVLKKEGLLSRDDRQVERKKTGLRKARKAPQFSKR